MRGLVHSCLCRDTTSLSVDAISRLLERCLAPAAGGYSRRLRRLEAYQALGDVPAHVHVLNTRTVVQHITVEMAVVVQQRQSPC